MTPFKRIDPADAPRLFSAANLKPVAQSWGGDGCGCLAIAMCQASGKSPWGVTSLGDVQAMAARWNERGIRNGNASRRIGKFLGFETHYILGLFYGWDADPLLKPHPQHTPEYTAQTQAGWQDGYAARLACAAAGMIEAPQPKGA